MVCQALSYSFHVGYLFLSPKHSYEKSIIIPILQIDKEAETQGGQLTCLIIGHIVR